jgi:hypothetical protein
MQYRLRTLVIATTIGPPILAVVWWLLPHTLPLVATLYFATAAIYFAAWWQSVCREAEKSRQLSLKNELDASGTP